jgi:transcriptional regulator
MYLPRHFEQAEQASIDRLLAAHPLATIVSMRAGEWVADHIPLMLMSDGPSHRLVGHVARANPFWQIAQADSADAARVLCVFQGPQAYISPNWYVTKQTDGRVVPTWNYMVVHVHGVVRAIEDPASVRSIVAELTRRHEAAQPAPWGIDDAPEGYIDKLLHAIVGIEVDVTSMVGKWKVSQNRPAVDRAGVVDGLRAHGHHAMADAVQSPG